MYKKGMQLGVLNTQYKGPNETLRCDNGTMKIKLSRGMCTIINFNDYEKVRGYRWRAVPYGSSRYNKIFYAQTNIWIDGKRTTRPMHQFIITGKIGMEIDHINHNGLDNRFENLKICSHSDNMLNMRKRRSEEKCRNGSISGCKDIHWDKSRNKWVVRISKDKGKHSIYIGRFYKLYEAITALKNYRDNKNKDIK